MADQNNEEEEEEEVPPLPPPIIPPIIPVPFSNTSTSHPPISTTTHNTVPPAIHPPIRTTTHHTIPPATHPPISTTAHHTVLPATHPPISTTTHHTVPSVTHPPISTTTHHTVPPVTHPPISTTTHNTLPPAIHPPINSNCYPLSYSQLPSWLPPPPLYDTMVTPTDHDSYLVSELALLKERVARLEEKLTSTPSTEMTSNNTGIPDLNSEQTMVIGMMSTNPSIGWKVALRKVLMVVFGEETLAGSCCKGRKNATFQPLDGTKLNAVKGIL